MSVCVRERKGGGGGGGGFFKRGKGKAETLLIGPQPVFTQPALKLPSSFKAIPRHTLSISSPNTELLASSPSRVSLLFELISLWPL